MARGRGSAGKGKTDAAVEVEDGPNRSAATNSFVDITQAPPDVAKHFLEAYGWDIEAAVTGYLENGLQRVGPVAAHGGNRGGRHVVEIDDDGDANDTNGGGDGDGHDIEAIEEDVEEIEDSDNSYDQLQTLASHRSTRSTRSTRARRAAEPVDYRDGAEDDDDDDDDDGDEDYMDEDEDVYGEEEDRFKYGRRSRRGHRRSLRRMGRDAQAGDALNSEHPAQSIPQAVLSLPDVNLEEQKMLLAAMTGQAYEGDIPDFSNYAPYVPKPMSPGAMARQMLRDEQDMAFQESLELDRERRRQAEMAQIEQMEREASARLEQQASLDLLEAKKRRLPVEPAADDADALALVIRLPSGTRLKRRFSRADAMGSVFDFVDVEGDSELTAGKYQLVTNFPRKVFELGVVASLSELFSSKQEALFVEQGAT